MLKDWKRYTENEWSRKDDRYSFVKVWKTGLSSNERKRRGIGLYFFSGRVSRNGIETKKSFKTKSQALRFAKSYMRDN
ncbi:MAG: hypothetical protein AABY22_10990 [Nanoarchaeota archaeon]